MKKHILFISLICAGYGVSAQSVGIGTKTPHASAVLEVSSNNKGVLIPTVALQSASDKNAVPNPANGLLIYKPANAFNLEGFYYNMGKESDPMWQMLGASLTLPYMSTASYDGALFYLENTGNSFASTAIDGFSTERTGVWGSTNSGRGVIGKSSGSGTGVYAYSLKDGVALHVNGRLKITGPGLSAGVGKLLTSDANGNATWQAPAIKTIAFSVNGVEGSGAIGFFEQVKFSTENYNLGNGYSGAPSYSFQAPVHGIYQFTASLKFLNNGLLFYPAVNLVRKRNGVSEIVGYDYHEDARSKYTGQVTIDCELLPGDIVFVSAKNGHVTGDPLPTLSTVNYTAFFNGRLLQKL
ncbi:complement C1q domain-containing protein [Dyadobacter sp. LJ53]|uniref:complement C1q domain-containing protein n=1 Tax=Dyadobacter chenwenxiniae TaxID=2906456 RepID=UPI001F2BA024|nr:complement C1q domain-containing protein [Dyadobacter chenwenxiniae]MCF0050562.1 complement C1q domain-containing protein [Dyadobacter chenwenxiniae]